MTRYLISFDDGAMIFPEEELPAVAEAAHAVAREAEDSGVWVFGGGLHAPSTATVVNATGADVTVTDGPYAETKEHIGGFWVLEAADLDAALELAKKASAACGAPVEVRPFQDEPAE